MSAAVKLAQRRPVTGSMIRAAGKAAPAARPELPLLLKAAAEALCKVLGSYAQAPFRCEADGLSITHREVPVAQAETLKLVSPRGVLTPLIVSDRRFLMGLCEAGFGGSGTEEPFDGDERPLSHTETRLLKAVMHDVAAALPAVLGDIFATAFRMLEDDGRSAPPAAGRELAFVTGRILVHVFGYTGEITLLLPEAEIAALFAAGDAMVASQTGAESQTRYQAAVLDAGVVLAAQLPQELMPLGAVSNLRRGQLLKFRADVRTPVRLSADGVTLFTARLGVAGDAMQLEILST